MKSSLQFLLPKRNLALLSICALIVAVFFGLRLWGLDKAPLFTDEAIYVRWMQIGAQDPKERFIPLTDGKPPLYHWLGMLAMATPVDPVVAARLVSLAGGLLSLLVMVLIGVQLRVSKFVLLWIALAVSVHPMMVVYDRLAVVDSLLTALTLATIWLLLRLKDNPNGEKALVAGFAWGLALLTKTSALLTIGLAPMLSIVDSGVGHWKRARYLLLLPIVVVVGQLMYQSLRVSPLFFRIEQKNAEFVVPISTVLADPFAMTYGNLKSLVAWLVGYSTMPLVLLAIVSVCHPRFRRFSLVVWFFILAQLLLMASFNKIIFARYLLTLSPLLILLAGLSLEWLKDYSRVKIGSMLFLIWPLIVSLSWIVTPSNALIPVADSSQYYGNWTAGHGLEEIVFYLKQAATDGPLLVGTQGTFGLMPYGLEIYLADNPNVTIESFWPVDTIPASILSRAGEQPTFFVYNEIDEVPANQPIELIMEFPRTDQATTKYLRLYRVGQADIQ